jgi:hypothetical protein
MSKLLLALGSMMPSMAKKPCCPDCGGEMDGKECLDCGYGGEDDGEEEGGSETQALLDARKALQTAMELIDRLIVKD